MGIDVGAQLDLLDLDGLLLLARLGGFLLGLVLVFAVIHDLADWRVGIANLHKIKARFLGTRHSIALADDAKIFSALGDELNLPGDNGLVDARAVFIGGFRSHWSANGRILLCC
jgi:hypothetical protein